MALFDKLYTKFLDPYAGKGRWYKTVIVNDAIVSSDFENPTIYNVTSAQYLMCDDVDKLNLIDYKVEVEYDTSNLPSTTRTFNLGYRATTNGRAGVIICPPMSYLPYKKQTVYVYAERV